MKTFVLVIIAALIISGCGIRTAPEQITMTMEYDGFGDALYMGCMAGLARRSIEREEYWTELSLQANGRLCEEVRRRYDGDSRMYGVRAEVF